jgi:hypothetical protein
VSQPHGPDDRLLKDLQSLLGRVERPPRQVIEAAKESYTWRTVDAELAALTSDSLLDPAVGVRGTQEPRLLTFEAGDLMIEVEVSVAGAERRLLGQLVPPQAAQIDLRQGATTRTAQADVTGRFAVRDLLARPFSLRCTFTDREPVHTEWVNL